MSLNYSSFLFTDKIISTTPPIVLDPTTPPIVLDPTTPPIVLDPTTENFTLTTATSSLLSSSITIYTTSSLSHFTQNQNIIFIVSSVGTFLIVLIVASSTILCILMFIRTRGTRTHPQIINSPIQVTMSNQKISLSDLEFKQHELGFDSISISISTTSGLVHQLQPDITSRLMTAVSTQVHTCVCVCVWHTVLVCVCPVVSVWVLCGCCIYTDL